VETIQQERMEELREIACDVLELEPEEISDTSLFIEDHNADSLRAIEILARIEKKYKVEIPQSELPRMVSLSAVYEVLSEYKAW
jgi:acyl carrier protein